MLPYRRRKMDMVMVRALVLTLITLLGTVAAGATDHRKCTLPSSNDHAIEDFNKAIEINPDYAVQLYFRGIAFEKKVISTALSPTTARPSISILNISKATI
jgi:hypothetical protein